MTQSTTFVAGTVVTKEWLNAIDTGTLGVQHYGALADNTTDDGPAIETTLNTLPRPSQIDFPAGTYAVKGQATSPFTFGNTTAEVHPGVILEGSNTTINGDSVIHVLDRTGSGVSEVQPAFTTLKNMTLGAVENLTFDSVTFDPGNDGATNSNQRFVYATGVSGLRYLNTRAQSSGVRRGYFSHIQNSENVLILGHQHKDVTGGYNFRYCDNVVISASNFDNFSEAVDFDSTAAQVAGGHLTFRSTSRVNQCMDLNSVQNVALGNIAVNTVGNIATINYKTTTPETFAEYVANTTPAAYTISRNVVLSGIVGSAVGDSTAVAFYIGWDWSAGDHSGSGPVQDITLRDVRLNDVSECLVREARGLVIDGYHVRDVTTSSSFAALHFINTSSTDARVEFSDLDFDLLNSSVIGCNRGAVFVSAPSRAVIRNFRATDINTLGGSDSALRLTSLHTRAGRVTVDGCDLDGGVVINGDSTAIPAWAISTTYVKNKVVSNGGRYYLCTTGGTSAGAGGPTGTGVGITDNTVVWRWLEYPYAVFWGEGNRVTGTLTLQGDAHQYIFGRTSRTNIGDVGATTNYTGTLFVAERRCYVARAKFMVNSAVTASGTDYRTLAISGIQSGVSTTIASPNTIAGWAANTRVDAGFSVSEVGAYLEAGDSIKIAITSASAGAALSGLSVDLEIIKY